MAILWLCVSALSGCAMLKTHRDITVFGNGDKVFYDKGEAVSIASNSNTNGLWVMSPSQLRYLVLDGIEGK